MGTSRFILFIAMAWCCQACYSTEKSTAYRADRQPTNIIYILADDLGYGELGSYGQQLIETPHLDELARGGLRFTQHYSGAPVCAPARCVLLTGQHTGHAYVRGNDEWGERGKVWDYQAMFDDPFLEGQRPLPDSIVTLAEILQDAGYTTGMVGKWGLGAPTTEGVPNKQGFDFFYGYNCQRQAHTFYPMHLWKNEERVLLDNKFVPLHANLPEGADPNDPQSYADFQLKDYSPELMHTEALRFLENNQDQPFFLYYASPIPHLPLQAPEAWVKHYQEKFGPEKPYTGTSYFPNRTPRATYAAMISYLDQQVGELVAKLKELGVYENTLILFSSDNGPSYVAGVDAEFFNSAGPFPEGYGNTKGFVREGGIRVPMIAHWPGKIKARRVTEHISAFYDVLPTVCDLIDVPVPISTDGISFLPVLLSEAQPTHDYLYWEFPSYGGQQAVRMGDWKGIRNQVLAGNTDLELYQLQADIQEEHDVAAQHPEVVARIEQIMTEAHTPAALDRFKIEALGDVKEAYLAARTRAEQLRSATQSVLLGEGYFQLSQNTRIRNGEYEPEAIAILQERLWQTGGYRLEETKDNDNNRLVIQQMHPGTDKVYRLLVENEQILLQARDKDGFRQGMEILLQLMDPQINVDKEMHHPVWTIAAVEIVGK